MIIHNVVKFLTVGIQDEGLSVHIIIAAILAQLSMFLGFVHLKIVMKQLKRRDTEKQNIAIYAQNIKKPQCVRKATLVIALRCLSC